MDMEQTVQNDSYSLFVPIEDHDLMKSVSVDENGDYIVQGVMSSDAKDEEDDSITPEGMDCSYFLEKGWIKYEHGNKPEQFIGEPIEVRVGRFEHPTLMKSVNGIFVKGRLFARRGMTRSAIEAMEDLQKSNTKRRMGWSIEGNVKERDSAGKIVKSVLRNVVLTMSPVNTTTWAELAKSFAKDHELTIDMPDVEKSMDIAGAQAITRQSIEGVEPEKDEQQEWIDAFRSLVKRALVNKSFGALFTQGTDEAEFLAFDWALEKGFDHEEADAFASYTVDKHQVLKALVTNFGGETMSNKVKESLTALLDTDLDELQKSLEADIEDSEDAVEEDEAIVKSVDADADDEDDVTEKGQDEEDEEDEEEDEETEDEEEDEDAEPAGKGKTKLSKSLSDGGHGQAFEVSEFLSDLTDELGFSLDGMEKSLTNVTKTQHATVKALASVGELVKGLASALHDEKQSNAEIREEIGELRKSLGEALNRPVGRKGVVNQREVQTLSKSLGDTPSAPSSRREVEELLMKSFDAGEIPGSVITRFEAGTPIQNLNLPANLKQTLGLSE